MLEYLILKPELEYLIRVTSPWHFAPRAARLLPVNPQALVAKLAAATAEIEQASSALRDLQQRVLHQEAEAAELAAELRTARQVASAVALEVQAQANEAREVDKT